MSEKIIPGDLVITLSAINENCFPYLGMIFTVKEPSNLLEHWRLNPATINPISGKEIAWHTKRLKKINPPSVDQSTPTKETICA